MRNILSAGLCALLLSGCTGMVAGPDFQASSQAAHGLGAQLVRVEFAIGSSCSSMEPAMSAYANNGARVLVLAGFDGHIPTTAEAQSLVQWAQCFGTGSTWADSHEGFAVDTIEFGNETSYCHQFALGCSGAWYNDPSYIQRAKDYGTRFMAARGALNLGGFSSVKLLAQADSPSGSINWVHNIKVGGVTSAAVGGWTIHSYGNATAGKLNTLLSQTSSEGFASTIDVDVTESGVTSTECNGSPVALSSNNSGWGNQLSYSQAASALNSTLDTIRSTLGDRLGVIMIYKLKDDNQPCGGSNGEQYFGAVHQDLSDKGTYSTEVRDQLTQ